MGLVKCTSAILRAQSARAGKQAGGLPRKVGVLGGGFGGLYTALKLEEIARNRGQPLPEVTLIDKGDKFVFKPLLYELLSKEYNESEVAIPFKDLLSSSQCVRHTQASVTSIFCDEGGPSAQLEGDGSISSMSFDHMIVALGSVVPDVGVPGAKEHAYAFNTLEDTISVSNRLSELEGQKSVNIAVVGGGFAGTELAASIAKRMQGSARVELITPRDVLPAAAEKQREIGRNKLERLGVALVQGKVTQIDSDGFELTRGSGMEAERRPADLLLWTVGSKAALPESHGFRLGSDGRILVEPTLRARQCASTFALGDAASSSSPATAQVALQQANYAAWNVLASAEGRPMLPFNYFHLGTMMSLGPGDAAISLPICDLALDGYPAAALRKAAYAYRMPTLSSAAASALGFVRSVASPLLPGVQS